MDRFRPFLLIIPALIGAGIAFGAIPFYGPVAFACSIEAPPFVESSAPSDFLFFLPAYIAISICTILMGMVYWRVRQQNHAARKWKPSSFRGIVKQLSGGVAPKKKKKVTALERMERQVLWQATLYLLGFYVTWPFAMICFKLGAKDSNANNVINYGTFLTGVTIFQLQGFFNAFTYFR